MSHMVIYRGADGKPGYHQTDDIHDAIGFVEQMRNEEGVEHARIFRLEEVVFEYRPYFRVELSAAGEPPVPLGGPQPAQLPEPEVPSAFSLSTPPMPSMVDSPEPIDLVEDVVEVVDHADPADHIDDLRGQPEVAMAKKGLFGR